MVPQVPIAPGLCDQLLMRAGLNEPAPVDHKNPVRAPNRRKAVRDHDNGFAFDQFGKRLLDAAMKTAVMSSWLSAYGMTVLV